MTKKAVLFLFLVLIFIGVNTEFSSLLDEGLSEVGAGRLFVSILLLGLYVIPGILLASMFSRRFNCTGLHFVLAMVGGGFMCGWLAGYGNDWLMKIGHLAESPWQDALTAPFVEEGIKFCCVGIVVYLLNRRRLAEVFLIGTGVGLGFQILEDISYLLQEGQGTQQEMLTQSLTRVAGAYSSHWAYTGLLAVGVFGLLWQEKKPAYFTLLVIVPLGLHFLWNSPLNEIQWGGFRDCLGAAFSGDITLSRGFAAEILAKISPISIRHLADVVDGVWLSCK